MLFAVGTALMICNKARSSSIAVSNGLTNNVTVSNDVSGRNFRSRTTSYGTGTFINASWSAQPSTTNNAHVVATKRFRDDFKQ